MQQTRLPALAGYSSSTPRLGTCSTADRNLFVVSRACRSRCVRITFPEIEHRFSQRLAQSSRPTLRSSEQSSTFILRRSVNHSSPVLSITSVSENVNRHRSTSRLLATIPSTTGLRTWNRGSAPSGSRSDMRADSISARDSEEDRSAAQENCVDSSSIKTLQVQSISSRTLDAKDSYTPTVIRNTKKASPSRRGHGTSTRPCTNPTSTSMVALPERASTNSLCAQNAPLSHGQQNNPWLYMSAKCGAISTPVVTNHSSSSRAPSPGLLVPRPPSRPHFARAPPIAETSSIAPTVCRCSHCRSERQLPESVD